MTSYCPVTIVWYRLDDEDIISDVSTLSDDEIDYIERNARTPPPLETKVRSESTSPQTMGRDQTGRVL